MIISIDFRSHEPIYAQIVEQVKQMIATGALKSGDQLPTVRQLALDLRVNFNTVARAYRMLDEAGMISTQQGRGTFILDQPPPADQKKLRRAKLSELTRGYLAEARRLGYEPNEVKKSFDGELNTWRAEAARQ